MERSRPNKTALASQPGISSSPLASLRSRQVRGGPVGWYLHAAPLHAPPGSGRAGQGGQGAPRCPARRWGPSVLAVSEHPCAPRRGAQRPPLLRGIRGARPGAEAKAGGRRGSARRGALAGLPGPISMYSYMFRAARVNICRQRRRPPMAGGWGGARGPPQ